MKLKRFKERDNKRIGVIVFTLVCLFLISGAVLYRTFAIFEVKTNQNVIKGKVGDMGDIQFAFYIDNQIVKESPKLTEKENYVFDEDNSTCTNGASVYWDYQRWGPTVSNLTETKTKCYLKFKKEYNEEILNGAVPKVKGDLVPVTIDDDGTVHKADITNKDNPWYKYEEQKWANAVILEDEVEDNYEPGEVISEDNIESYFVWIPRYKYQIWNGEEETSQFNSITENLGPITNATTQTKLNQQKEIKIKFENKHMPISTGTLKNEWLTHPAFTSFNSDGFWVGKFETGYKGATITKEAERNEQSKDKVIIKPNVYSWRSIQVSNAFYTSKDYKTNLDSHMMKNMEWGAVAYLTNSIYGRCKDNKCEEVRINNSSSYVTGSSSSHQPTCIATDPDINCRIHENSVPEIDTTNVLNYKNSLSVISSTTNNKSGIYDMSGGAYEYVMGALLSEDSNPIVGSSGFTNFPDSKYYDSYVYSDSNQQFQRGLFGDGTKEFGPFYTIQFSSYEKNVGSWHASDAHFVFEKLPWFGRGGYNVSGVNASLFAFHSGTGESYDNYSFRIVLTP